MSCFLVQVFSCIRILHQIEHSPIRRKKLADTWPKLRDVIGRDWSHSASSAYVACPRIAQRLDLSAGHSCITSLIRDFTSVWNIFRKSKHEIWICYITAYTLQRQMIKYYMWLKRPLSACRAYVIRIIAVIFNATCTIVHRTSLRRTCQETYVEASEKRNVDEREGSVNPVASICTAESKHLPGSNFISCS